MYEKCTWANRSDLPIIYLFHVGLFHATQTNNKYSISGQNLGLDQNYF
jgi:hypothetical protein